MVFCCILQYFVAKSVFLQVTLFCREICFCTIYVVLRGEKLSQKLYPWRKNDKYEVCQVDAQNKVRQVRNVDQVYMVGKVDKAFYGRGECRPH